MRCGASASLAAGAAPAFALTDEIAYRCDVDICLVQPDVPGGVTNLTGQRHHEPRRRPFMVARRDAGRLRQHLRRRRAEHLRDAARRPGRCDQPRHAAHPLPGRERRRSATSRGRGTDAGGVRPQRDATERRPASSWSPPTGRPSTPVTIAAADPDLRRSASRRGRPTGRRSRSPGSSRSTSRARTGPARRRRSRTAAGTPRSGPRTATRIAFDKINAGADPFVDLHVVNAGGGGTPVITPIPYSQWTFAAWSPDGDEDRVPVVDRKRRPHPRRACRRQPGHPAGRRGPGERLRRDVVAGRHARRVPGLPLSDPAVPDHRDLRRGHRRVGHGPRR